MIRSKTTVGRRKRTDPGFKLFATTEAGLENVLASELRRIKALSIVEKTRGVAFKGDLDTVFRANLWLRTANRVLLEIAEFEAPNREALYKGVYKVDWNAHLKKESTLAVDAVSHSSQLSHTQFASRVVKDAIVDGFRHRTGKRPNVDTRHPDLKLNARLLNDRCTLSIDTSGERLNRRGYRPSFGVSAPLKETLAAGILLKSGFDGSTTLIDPMCGSGTLLIEGAMIAKNIAPGLLGRQFGFMKHPSFDPTLWKNLVADAKAAICQTDIPIVGSDISKDALRAATAAAQGAGVDDTVRLKRADFSDIVPRDRGIIVTNPPYGERLGEIEKLAELYRAFGDTLKQQCHGMTAHILTGSKFLAGRIGLHPKKKDIIWNGAIECRLLHYDLY